MTAVGSARAQRWPWFSLGVLLCLLGPVLYVVQMGLKFLVVPWYVPILATLGVLFMVVSVWDRPRVWRIATMVLLVLLCGFEWFFVLVGTKSPVYTGPARPGAKVPAFHTTLASGQSFSDGDLQEGIATVLLFFRGRW